MGSELRSSATARKSLISLHIAPGRLRAHPSGRCDTGGEVKPIKRSTAVESAQEGLRSRKRSRPAWSAQSRRRVTIGREKRGSDPALLPLPPLSSHGRNPAAEQQPVCRRGRRCTGGNERWSRRGRGGTLGAFHANRADRSGLLARRHPPRRGHVFRRCRRVGTTTVEPSARRGTRRESDRSRTPAADASTRPRPLGRESAGRASSRSDHRRPSGTSWS
ncbi:MAG: hypothetical protein JWO56_2345 [Acidobacteria bacterium]|nr:hypothetical protein [Acidobacteriota bacterium]